MGDAIEVLGAPVEPTGASSPASRGHRTSLRSSDGDIPGPETQIQIIILSLWGIRLNTYTDKRNTCGCILGVLQTVRMIFVSRRLLMWKHM